MGLYDFIRNKTAKLRSFGKRFTRRASNRIAPAPAELAPLDPKQTSLSPRTKTVTRIQKSFKNRKTRKQAIADLSKRNSEKVATRRIQKSFKRVLLNPNLEECAICYGAMLQPKLTKTLNCGHTFHRKCIDHWAATNPHPRCPLCRAYIAPQRPYHLQTRLRMPISGNNSANTINSVNALIAGLHNAATMGEAIGLLNETDLLIDRLPHSEQALLREARTQVWTQTYARLQQAPRQSRATIDTINRANVLIGRMRNATTFAEARDLMDEITIIIANLPPNEFRLLADRQWSGWLHVHARVAAPIQSSRF